jgi:hypothetical protein
MKRNKSSEAFPLDKLSLWVVYENKTKNPYFLFVASHDYLRKLEHREHLIYMLEKEIKVLKGRPVDSRDRKVKKPVASRDRRREYEQLGREGEWLRQYLKGEESWDEIAKDEKDCEKYSLDEEGKGGFPDPTQMRRAVYDYCEQLQGRQFPIHTDDVYLKVGWEEVQDVDDPRRPVVYKSKVGKVLELSGTIGVQEKLFNLPGSKICAMMKSIGDYLKEHPEERKTAKKIWEERQDNNIFKILCEVEHKEIYWPKFRWLYEQTLRFLPKNTEP